MIEERKLETLRRIFKNAKKAPNGLNEKGASLIIHVWEKEILDTIEALLKVARVAKELTDRIADDRIGWEVRKALKEAEIE